MMLAPAESASLGWDESHRATRIAWEGNLVLGIGALANHALFINMLLFTVQ